MLLIRIAHIGHRPGEYDFAGIAPAEIDRYRRVLQLALGYALRLRATHLIAHQGLHLGVGVAQATEVRNVVVELGLVVVDQPWIHGLGGVHMAGPAPIA